MDPVDIPTIFVPVTIVNEEDPVRHIMDLLNAGYDAAQAHGMCGRGLGCRTSSGESISSHKQIHIGGSRWRK
jgi:hypothetical protein